VVKSHAASGRREDDEPNDQGESIQSGGEERQLPTVDMDEMTRNPKTKVDRTTGYDG